MSLLTSIGITRPSTIHRNLTAPRLIEEAVRRGEGHLTQHGVLIVNTGKYTGRSPNDKFTVQDGETSDTVWWGKVNRPITPAVFDAIHKQVLEYYNRRDEAFVLDCHAGTDPEYRLPVRIVCEAAWHNLFARNMFVRLSDAELADFKPAFTVIHAPYFEAKGATDGLNSEAFILADFSRKIVLIGGTKYAGEVKKSVFTVMNYLLPARGVLPMHCSANIGPAGDSALFFGLSGTGKTTLSADPKRKLIGDDEHGWSDKGIFNFEGGCYAKVINLSAEAEPEIYATTRRFGTVLENVVFDEHSRSIDLDSNKLTENTRASYPIDMIPNFEPSGRGGHPKNVVFLTCDAFGVLPPISRLSVEQAQYHFISGYTAKVAGTERGVKEPSATFSSCFGAPFMPRHPGVYARLLADKLTRHGAQCWLLNTGWTGGPYGVGKRMSIKHTRALLNAALEGKLNAVEYAHRPLMNLHYPVKAPDVPAEILDPRNTWADKAAYDEKAKHLAQLFKDNFKQFEDGVSEAVRAAGPKG
ncbi:MAG: phosphoenolpyruvate carboxykinase [Planctomycetes bacterium]|nr:phosphoenolpyruvate carboxykinase [Planctomycetota bacterium]MCW8135299.1 phosphoenolpyruvate carboxykinase [Planctomycetota bacterium]